MDSRKIEVVAYSPQWPDKFSVEKDSLLSMLKPLYVNIEHIGSTSVPGLPAKPIIDILIEINDISYLDAKADEFTALHYEVKGENGIPGRRYYQKGGNNRSHHIHAFQSGTHDLFRHRAFRDYLIAHPSLAQQYAAIKQHAAHQCQHDNDKYISLKNDFILEHEKRAVDWYESRQLVSGEA